ncbi:MAG: carboxypeptidase regulatory-like domain-containing protein [Gemmatimonadetes bacterium]|nr:carboxypeptidase regulatory-like domain-containing protein [Gemmatimonadota bacterium]
MSPSRTLSRCGAALVLAACAVATGLFAAPALQAQVGTTTEIIAGRVTDTDGQPIANARVQVTSVATGVARTTTSRTDGRFTLLFRDGGAQYRLQVTALGRAPANVVIARRGDEDRLVADVKLSSAATQLSSVQVRARAGRPGAPPASTAGGTEAVIPNAFLTRFPLTPGDLAAAASLVPGVVTVAGGDSTPASFSVGGQPANQNNVTLDGASFLFGTLPQNAVRAVRVVTNAYDPSRGQFTGGQIATTTLSGTPRTQGTFTATTLPTALQAPTVGATTFPQRTSQLLGSLGIGGPLRRNSSYYYLAAESDRRSEPRTTLRDASAASLARLGLANDSVQRFLGVVNATGLDAGIGAPDDRVTTSHSVLGRIDWDAGATHAVMLRGDLRRVAQNSTRFGGVALGSTGGEVTSTGGGFLTSLTSTMGAFINEARVYASADRQELAPFLRAPLGVVTVAGIADSSGLGGARAAQVPLQFGGNASLPRTVSSSLLEAGNELSRLVGTAHRVKLGVLVNSTRTAIDGAGNQQGTYLYNSLADFTAARPALYARTLNASSQRAGATTAAVYVGDAWRVNPSLQVVYGTRIERTTLPGVPARNVAVEQAFGRRTDAWPTDVRVTPRIGFSYLLGNVAGIPSGTLKGGVGLFRGTIPAGLVGAVANGTGLADAQAQVVCTGAAVPTPDWRSFADGTREAPTQCATGTTPQGGSGARPTALLFDSGFGAPEVWRASLGFTRQFKLRWAAAADIVQSFGQRNPIATDLNLPTARFTLDAEGNRVALGAPSDVASTTGATTGNASRPSAAFGPALLLGARGASRSTQVTLTLAGPSFRAGGTSVSYTYNRATDQSNGYGLGAAIPTTDGDPNRLTWGTSDLERRHQVVGQQISNFPHGVEVTLIGRLTSGPRYTPMVNGDVNADGQRNDRAFVPASGTGSALARDITRLLALTDARAADCLRAQAGRIAERNSCTSPWTPQLDVQVNWHPRAALFADRVTFSLIAANTLAGVDRLLHGQALKGWGQPVLPDRNLLTVTGFDAASRRWQYAVNDRFGTPMGARNPFGQPFQVTLRMQVGLGYDAARANLRTLTGAASSDSMSLPAVKARVLKQVPYPVDSLLRKADSLQLGLSAEQVAQLQALGTRYRAYVDARGDEFAALLTSNNGRPDMGAIAPKLQQLNLGIVRELQTTLKQVEGVLTPAQWAKVPDKIRFPFGQQQPGAQ